MAFKVSNETKIGALAAIAITLLILGFNFLKGKTYSSKTFLYAKFKSIDGLLVSNAVTINGYQVGTVNAISEANEDLDNIIVQFKITKDIRIPQNALATISSNPLGGTTMEIKLPAVRNGVLKTGDTVLTGTAGGLLAGLTSQVGPIGDSLKMTMGKLNAVLENFNSVLDPNTKGNMQGAMSHANLAMASIVKSTAELEKLLNSQTGALAQTMNHASTFSKTLADNGDKITATMGNLQKTSENFTKIDLDASLQKINGTVASLQSTLAKVNSNDGTLGALMNDRKLYNNLSSTVNSLNLLMQDLRLNPKRYVNISIFGKKNTTDPLMKPMSEDTITQEQHR